MAIDAVTEAPRAPEAPGAPGARRGWVLLAVALGTFMTYLDNNVVNVAIPTIQRSLGLSESGIEWVVSAYILFFAGLLLAGGRLADVIGRRRLFVIGLVVFTVASLLAGAASTAAELIGARALQGIGAALLTPTTLAIVSTTFAAGAERARAIAIWGAVGALALAVGPVIGGVLTEHASWHWIFLLNVPMGAATLALAMWSVPRDGPLKRRAFDTAGVVTSAVALFALTYALIEGTHLGWSSTPIVAALATFVAGTVAFLRVEHHSADPMVDLHLFRSRSYSSGVVVVMLWAFGLFGIYFFTAIYLQSVLGFSATKAGLAFVPMALLMAVGASVSDRAAASIGPNRLVGMAMVGMAIGIASASLLGAHASFAELMVPFAIIGVSGGLTIPLTNVIVSGMPASRAGIASGVFNASREVAGLLGITVIGVVLTARQHAAVAAGRTPVIAFLDGYRPGLLVAAALVGAGGVVAYVALPRYVPGAPPAEEVTVEKSELAWAA